MKLFKKKSMKDLEQEKLVLKQQVSSLKQRKSVRDDLRRLKKEKKDLRFAGVKSELATAKKGFKRIGEGYAKVATKYQENEKKRNKEPLGIYNR